MNLHRVVNHGSSHCIILDENDGYDVEYDEVKENSVEGGKDVIQGGLVGVELSFGVFIVLFIIGDRCLYYCL